MPLQWGDGDRSSLVTNQSKSPKISGQITRQKTDEERDPDWQLSMTNGDLSSVIWWWKDADEQGRRLLLLEL